MLSIMNEIDPCLLLPLCVLYEIQNQFFQHVKCGLRSSSTKFLEPSASKGNKPFLEGDENPSIEEQWIIPPFFEDYLFDKSLDWDSAPYSEDPLCTACGKPNDPLTMDM